MKTTYRSPYVVVVDTEDTSSTYLDAEKPISTRLFSAKVAWGLLNPVDCSYTLVFSSEGKVPCTVDMPEEHAERKDTLALFAVYDKITVKDLRAVEPKPKGPYCTAAMGNSGLTVETGCQKWHWRVGRTVHISDLTTGDITALCNPHKCEVKVNACTEDESLISYFTLGILTPEEMLRYDRFTMTLVRNKEH